MLSLKITGVGLYLPSGRETKADFIRKGATEEDVEYFGIFEKRVAPDGMGASDMELEAAKLALTDAGLKATDIDLIIGAPLLPEMIGAPNSNLLQHRLGAKNAAAFDISQTCGAIVSSLMVSSNFITLRQYKRILLTASTNWSVIEDPAHPEYCFPLSDGAAAVVLTASEPGYGILSFDMKTDGKYYYNCGSKVSRDFKTKYYREHNNKLLFYIDETDVFGSGFGRRILTIGPSTFKSALKKANLSPDDIDCAVIQGIARPLVSAWMKGMKVPPERFPLTYSRYGHLSVVVTLANLKEGLDNGMIKKGDNVALVSVGAGISAGCVVMRWS